MKRFGIVTIALATILVVLALTVVSTFAPGRIALGASEAGSLVADRTIQLATPTARAAEQDAETSRVALNLSPAADVETDIYEAVYRDVNPSVVYIANQAQVRARTGVETLVAQGSGSGFVWDDEGHIVTNNHVVAGADRLEVTFSDGIVVPADLVATDPDSDLAVIRIDPELIELDPVELGDINDVVVGSRAIAIGNPYGLVGTMTTGIVSAIGRSLASNPDDPSSYSIPQVLQTDAAINPGNSGGPLLNEAGDLIGVNFQIRSNANSNSGVGFAIPVNIVNRVVPALISDGQYQHAYLGVRGQTFSPAWADALGFDAAARGAYVLEVVSEGPADRAGLRGAESETDVVAGVGAAGTVYLMSGGDLIIAVDDQPVKTFDDVLVYLENFKSPGDEIALTLLRENGERAQITLTLGARPSASL